MKTLKPILLTIAIFPFLLNSAEAIDLSKESFKLLPQLSGSYIVGAQIFNDNIIYSPGYALHFSTGYVLNRHINIGGGIGYLSFIDENFVPVFTEFTGFKSKKKNSPFTKLQLGYSFAGNKLTFDLNNYDMKGGIYFNWGGGYKWKISEAFSILASINYTQQFAMLSYIVSGSYHHTESVDFAMLRFSIGILKH